MFYQDASPTFPSVFGWSACGEYSRGECSLCECSPTFPQFLDGLPVGSTSPGSAPSASAPPASTFPQRSLNFWTWEYSPASAPSASYLETYLVLRLASEDYKCRKTREVYSPQRILNFWIPVGSTPPASAPPANTPPGEPKLWGPVGSTRKGSFPHHHFWSYL